MSSTVESDSLKQQRRRVVRSLCRAQVEMVVRCAIGGSNEWSVNKVELKSRLLDLAPDGAILFMREDFAVGQELKLTLHLPEQAPISAMAQVRSSKPLPDKGGNAISMRFTKISDRSLGCIKDFLLAARAGKYPV